MPYRSLKQSRFIHAEAARGTPWAKRFVADSHGTHVQKRKSLRHMLKKRKRRDA